MDAIPYSNCNKCGVLFDLYDKDNSICRACVDDDPIWAVIQERDQHKAQHDECRANLEWLVYWCLRSNDPPISIGRGKELLGFTDMMQMRAWMADYSYRDNWGGNERDV